MKRFASILSILLIFMMCACSPNDASLKKEISGNTYIREKGGFGSDFFITLNEDGTLHYYEGALSSHIGIGSWDVEKGKLILHEGEKIFRFQIKEKELDFIRKDSAEFLYMDVEDGDRFLLKED